MNTKKQKKLTIGDKEYTGEGHVRIYVDLQQIAKHSLTALNKEQIDFYQYLIVPMVFCAHTIEAYLNHIGRVLFRDYWEDIERGMSPLAKLVLVTEKLSLSLDMGSRPFQTFTQIFQYRNMIVHGKTEILNKVQPNPKIPPEIKFSPVTMTAKWEDWTTLANANLFYNDMEKMVEVIHKNQTIDHFPAFGIRGTSVIKTHKKKPGELE